MRKNSKIFGLIACSAVLAGAVAMGASNVNVAPAAAEGEVAPVTFEVAQQAQVNYEKAAIRFAATVSADYLATLGTTVKLVSSIDKAGNTDAGEAVTQEWIVKGEGSTYVDGYTTNTYYHSISFSDAELLDKRAAAAVDLTATMWLVSDDVEVEGSKQEVTRSMRNVANTVYDEVDSNKQSDLAAYFGSRFTAKNAFKELGTADLKWVVDGGAIADTVYKNNALVGADLEVGTTDTGSYALWVGNDVYNVPSVTYVTDAIEDTTEFNPFFKAGVSVEGGHYTLVTDIGGLDNIRLAGNGSKKKFATTLDGNGHDIYVMPHYYGLFGTPGAGATIKNFGLHIMGWQKSGNGQLYRNFLFYNYIKGVSDSWTPGCITVENIYVDFAEDLIFDYANLIGGVASDIATAFKIKDVIINLGSDWSTVEAANSSLIFSYWNQPNAGWSTSVPMLENVNVIASAQPIARSDADVVCYAQNDKALRDADTTNTLSGNYQYNTAAEGETENWVSVGQLGLFGWKYVQADDGDVTAADGTTWKLVQIDKRVVNRYDDLAAMAADENAQLVGNWKVTADGVSWVNSGN